MVPCVTLSFGNGLIPRALPYTWALLYLNIPRALLYPWATTWDIRVSLSTHGGVTPLSTIKIVDNCGNFLRFNLFFKIYFCNLFFSKTGNLQHNISYCSKPPFWIVVLVSNFPKEACH